MYPTLHGQPQVFAPGSPGFNASDPYTLEEVNVSSSKPKNPFDFSGLFSALPGIISATAGAFTAGNQFNQLPTTPEQQPRRDYTSIALIIAVVVVLLVIVKLLKK